MNEIDIINRFKKEQLEKAKWKSVEVFKFTESFKARFPIETIRELTLEEYIYVPYDEYNPSKSFCSIIWREATIMSSKGDIRTNVFGIYELNNRVTISNENYLAEYGDNIDAAFRYLKEEIYKLLSEVENDNFEAVAICPINRAFRYKLLEIYFPDKFVHVHTEKTLNDYLDCVGLKYDPKEEQVFRNLALSRWRDSVSEISDWDNSVLMSFCDWLWREHIKIDGSKLKIDLKGKAIKLAKEIDSTALMGTEKEAIVKVRVNQGIFRDLLLNKYSKCCLCGVNKIGLLRASHIKPWAESDAEEKLDSDNGFLLCPNHDLLFDKGYISFNYDGSILISEELGEANQVYMNVNPNMKIKLSNGNQKYLKFHREKIFYK